MSLNKKLMAIIVLVALIVGGLLGGILLSEEPLNVFAAGQFQDDDDDGENEADEDEAEEDDSFTGTVPVPEGAENPENLAEISQDEAEQAALEANPGTQTEEVELEVENGFLVYEVELDNGMEIVVDAGNGEILHSEMDD